ncbi:hypothetical protein [Acinetobacter sp. WCHAc060025]|uniref:hypothetical protein n=1 Tax=Acinetobacter sp. WCHAc060025 TaxID=2518625 RepID=UPI001022EA7F|nr:hypothetical protein [Acinetobacter sp. WCHAc060025]RZG75786.1 hypothetical protein EXE09_10235 [Acinetobacter sp. WCHAc060025]
MTHTRYIQFHPADDPTQLSKIGNWVITFLSDQHSNKTQLAITNVIPCQILETLQPRRFVIENMQTTQNWSIQSIECFDSTLNKTFELELDSYQAIQFIQQLLSEFERYDVEAVYND